MRILRDGMYLVTVPIDATAYILWLLNLRHDGRCYTATLI